MSGVLTQGQRDALSAIAGCAEALRAYNITARPGAIEAVANRIESRAAYIAKAERQALRGEAGK